MSENTTNDRSTADFLDDLDAKAARDTAGPEDEEEDQNTGDPEDEEAQDTGAPVATVRADVMAHLGAIAKRNGGKHPSPEDLVGLVLHHRRKARRTVPRVSAAPPHAPPHPIRHFGLPHRRVLEFRND